MSEKKNAQLLAVVDLEKGSARQVLNPSHEASNPIENGQDIPVGRITSIVKQVILCVLCLLVAFRVTLANNLVGDATAGLRCRAVASKISYATVPHVFKQDKSNANSTKIGPAPERFGLIDSKGHYWKKFQKRVSKMNERSNKTSYKVLFISRHGEGFHNVGMEYYGEDEWDKKWGRMNGNGSMTWGPDAQLTPVGVSQAEEVHALWLHEMKKGGGIPLPTRLFVSPLSRALHTYQITFAGVVDDPPPTIIEDLRDAYGLRTSDLRHNKSWIHENYPTFHFEDGFKEQDELWVPGVRETDDHVQERVKTVLDDLLSLEDTYIAIVAHSTVVEATFKVVHHQDFDVPTGGVVPILIKVTHC